MSTVAEPIAAVHTTATPRLTFNDAAKAIEFYKQAFGAKENMRFEVGGSIPHADITIGDSRIILSEEWPEGGRFSAETLGHSPVQLSLQVEDVDPFAARAVAAGLKTILPIKDQFYGRREGSFVDPFGYTWNISTVKEEMSVEEMHRRMKGMTTGPEGGQMSAKDEVKVDPVPRGFRMVSPYLVAEDGPALLDFAKQGVWGGRTIPRCDAKGWRTRRNSHWRFHADDRRRRSGAEIPWLAASQRAACLCGGCRRGVQAGAGSGCDFDRRAAGSGLRRALRHRERCRWKLLVHRDRIRERATFLRAYTV